jgi:hypothetical protein
VANLEAPNGYPYALKAPLPSDDINKIVEQYREAPNLTDGSSHAPSGDLSWSGANGGGLDFDTGDPVPFKGALDTSDGLTMAGDLTITGDLAITTAGNIATTGKLEVTAPAASTYTAITGTGDGSGAGVAGVGATGVFGIGSTAGIVGGGATSSNGHGVTGQGDGSGSGGVFAGGSTGKGIVCNGGSGSHPAADIGTGGAQFTGASPSASADPGANNMLFGANILKAGGYITTNGSGGVTLHDGYNIASVSVTSSYVLVTFARAFFNTTYWPVACGAKNPSALPVCDMVHGSTSSSALVVAFLNLDGGGIADPSATAVAFTLMVGGRQ